MIKVSHIADTVLTFSGRKKIQPHFSMRFVEESGAVVHIPDCICTSKYFKERTIRINITASGAIRKVRTATIIEFNGKPTCV